MSRKDGKQKSGFAKFFRFLIFVAIVAAIGFAYYKKDVWIPKLEGIGSRYSVTVTQNDGTLAEGNFPLSFSSDSGYTAKVVDENLFLLHDDYLDIYSIHGDSKDSRQHTYQNASITTCGKYALVYEVGGTAFRLDNKSKNFYDKTVNNDIITGRVGDDGTVVLVTESDTYACEIVVYDNNGKKIYKRSCTELVTNVILQSDNGGCYIVSVEAENGAMHTNLTSVSFSKKEDEWTSIDINMTALYGDLSSTGDICLVGDTSTVYFTDKGEYLGAYPYSGELQSASLNDGQVALVVQGASGHNTNLVLLNREFDAISTVELASDDIISVKSCDGEALIMYPGNVTSYDFENGSALATVELDDSYDDFLKEGNYLFLLGYEKIDRVDFKE